LERTRERLPETTPHLELPSPLGFTRTPEGLRKERWGEVALKETPNRRAARQGRKTE